MGELLVATDVFMLEAAEDRYAPVSQYGEEHRHARYELGRFSLTPFALRTLERTIATALKAYRASMGHDLATIEEMQARGSMAGFQQMLEQPRDEEDQPPKNS